MKLFPKSEAKARPTAEPSGEPQVIQRTGPGPGEGPSARPARLTLLVAAILLTSVALRFWTHSQLWLDEALTVNIARLPLARIPQALRHDGAPPLYYVLLHLWMLAFGTSNTAVRSLSGILGVASLVAMFSATRHYRTPAVVWGSVLLLATSPFAVRYATEARMYSLLMLLTLLGVIALRRFLRRPSWPWGLALAGLSGLSLLTHYWALYLIAAAGLLLAIRWLRHDDRNALMAIVALAGGFLVFLPWAPIFLWQMRHTGTPWAGPPSLSAPIGAVMEWAGASRDSGQALGISFFALAALGLFGAGIDRRRIEIDLATRPEGRSMAAMTFLTLALAVAAGLVTRSGFVVRYTSVVFPLFLILVALGLEAFVDPRVRTAVLTVLVVLGLLGAVPNIWTQRTQAGRVAQVLNTHASDGDLVAFCPDQLGPPVSRLVTRHLTEMVFPTAAAPERVDWVDYAKRNKAANVGSFEQMLLRRAGAHDLWLVWSGDYRTFGSKCETLVSSLGLARPGFQVLVKGSGRYQEPANLTRYPVP